MRSVPDKRPWYAPLLAAARGQRGVGAWLLVLLAVYLLLQLIFLLANLWAAALPHAPIVAALEQGLTQNLWSTADYPSDGIGHAVPAFPFAGVSDAYTQCIALTMNVPTVGAGLWDAALAGRHLGTCSAAVPALGQIAAGVDAPFLSYNRYWNGYSALTRPLLLLGGVGMVRIVIAVLFAAALVFAAVMLSRHVSRVAPLVLLPLVLSTNVLTQPTDSFPHALAFAVLLTGMGLGARWGSEPLPFVFLGAAAVASVFNFVDYLLNPPVAWALFVFAVVAARWSAGRGRLRGLWAAGGIAAIGWVVGYGATWMTRWVLAVATFGDSAWQEILGVIGNRLQGQVDGLVLPGPLEATRRNTQFWLETIPTAPAVAVAALVTFIACLVWMLVRREWVRLGAFAAMAAAALLVPMWFELLNNHSQIHLFFVYRAVPTAVGVAAAAALVAVFTRRASGAAPVRPPVVGEADVA